MGTIGIVANPNSGKDMRRLVSHATIIGNTEKISIIRRIISSVYELGNHQIYIMPDLDQLGDRALDRLKQPDIRERVTIPSAYVTGKMQDTVDFVDYIVNEKKIDIVIVLGGDGTSRATAKEIKDVPLIPISTGTNNVYPTMIEGTAVAVAAAAIADGVMKREDIPHGKLIEVSISNGQKDIALVDAVVSSRTFIGARAIIHEDEIDAICVTQAHPANIGFSALAGTLKTILPGDDNGMYVELDWDKKDYIAAISPGMLTRFGVKKQQDLKIGEELVVKPGYSGTVALDGEREMEFGPEDEITMKLTQNGPRKVDVKDVVEKVVALGYLHPGAK